MSINFKELVEHLNFDDLQKIKKDLEKGGLHMKKLIKKKIKDGEKQHEKSCSICMNDINGNNVNNFTLIFGPDSFRKKATFCGIDCLKYFLTNLENMKNDIHQHGKQQ